MKTELTKFISPCPTVMGGGEETRKAVLIGQLRKNGVITKWQGLIISSTGLVPLEHREQGDAMQYRVRCNEDEFGVSSLEAAERIARAIVKTNGGSDVTVRRWETSESQVVYDWTIWNSPFVHPKEGGQMLDEVKKVERWNVVIDRIEES